MSCMVYFSLIFILDILVTNNLLQSNRVFVSQAMVNCKSYITHLNFS